MTKNKNLPEYKPHIVVDMYKQTMKAYPNFEFLTNEVQMKTDTWMVDKLYWYYNQSMISSLPPYLQRVLLEEVWGAKNNKKAKSFIRSIWKGLGCLTPMTLVPITLILKNVEEKISYSTKPEILKQLKQLRTAVKKALKHNVMFINIDGQTRSNCAIKPYIEGEFNLSDDDYINDPIMMYDENSQLQTDIGIHKFNDLTPLQQGKFRSQNILINIINKGTLKQVSEALIAINSNEKWKEWQQIYNNAEPTVLKYAINEVMSNDPIKDFLTITLDQGYSYKKQFSGWEWFVAENLTWLKHLKTPSLTLLSDISKGNESSPDKPQIDFVKKMVTNWINNYKSSKSVKPVILSSYIDFRNVLKNFNNKNHSFYMSYGQISEVDVLSEGKFLTWYINTITRFESKIKKSKSGKNVLNDTHWVQDSNTGKHSSVPESWPAHCEGGINLVSKTGRIKWLLDSLIKDMNELTKTQVISNMSVLPDMSTIIVANNFLDTDGDKIDQTTDEVFEKGHIQSKYNDGNNKVNNLAPQKKKSNRSYSKKNLIQKKRTKKQLEEV
jgi:hypothetical protein